MKTYRIEIATATSQALTVVGTFVKVVSTTGVLTLRVEAPSGKILSDSLDLDAGDKPRFSEAFNKLTLTNDTGSDITAVLIVGLGDHDAAAVAGTVNVGNHAAPTFDSLPDLTAMATGASSDIAADATRRELIVQCPQTNTGEVCVRDQSGVTSEGIRVYPGEQKVFACRGAMRIRNNSGAVQDVFLAETKT